MSSVCLAEDEIIIQLTHLAPESLQQQVDKTTGWLEQNTAEKWMAENPETAKEVQRVIAEKKEEQNKGGKNTDW